MSFLHPAFPSFPSVFLSLSLSATLSAAEAPDSLRSTPLDPYQAEEMIRSGNTLMKTGSIVAGAGLLIGGAGGNPYVATVGLLATWVGIPMVGMGADKLNHGAELLNPAYQANYRGWNWYWAGVSLDAVSFVLGFRAGVAYVKAQDDGKDQEDAVKAMLPNLIPALVAGLAGTGCKVTSFIKFAKLTGEGRRAARGEEVSLSLQPTLLLAGDGAPIPGAALTIGF